MKRSQQDQGTEVRKKAKTVSVLAKKGSCWHYLVKNEPTSKTLKKNPDVFLFTLSPSQLMFLLNIKMNGEAYVFGYCELMSMSALSKAWNLTFKSNDIWEKIVSFRNYNHFDYIPTPIKLKIYEGLMKKCSSCNTEINKNYPAVRMIKEDGLEKLSIDKENNIPLSSYILEKGNVIKCVNSKCDRALYDSIDDLHIKSIFKKCYHSKFAGQNRHCWVRIPKSQMNFFRRYQKKKLKYCGRCGIITGKDMVFVTGCGMCLKEVCECKECTSCKEMPARCKCNKCYECNKCAGCKRCRAIKSKIQCECKFCEDCGLEPKNCECQDEYLFY